MKPFLLICSLTFFCSYGQTPSINLINPVSTYAGDSVTISGSGFNTTTANNVVYFGSNSAKVLSANATQLKVQVPAGTTYKFVTATDIANNKSGFYIRPFRPFYACAVTPGINSTSFSPTTFTVGNSPRWNAIGDIDGDKKPELVTADYFGNTLTVLQNANTGFNNFSSSSLIFNTYLATGVNPRCVELEDINSDGKLDVLVVNQGSNTFSIFVNTSTPGAISFQNKVDFNTGASPYTLNAGDFNRDGKTDVIVVNKNNNTVGVYENISSGGTINSSSFSTPVVLAVGTNPCNSVTDDFDLDGLMDIGICNSNSADISIYRNLGTTGTITAGTFSSLVNYPLGVIGTSLVFADLDHNVKPDIIATSYANSWASVFINTSTPGTISFSARLDFNTGLHPYRATVGDFDGDNKLDIAVANSDANSVSVFRNLYAGGTFSLSSLAAPVNFTVGALPYFVSSGDLDGDNDYELISCNFNASNITVLKNLLNTCPANAGIEINGNPLSENNVNVFPNPTIKDLKVRILASFGKGTIRVLNALGEEVKSAALLNGNEGTTLDVSDLSVGMYFVSITLDNQKVTKKFFVVQ